MSNTTINLTLNFGQYNYGQYDLRVPVGMTMKELLYIVSQAYTLPIEVNNPSIRVQGRGIVLSALQRLEDVNDLHDGIQLDVETL